jgi:hypothetical protein
MAREGSPATERHLSPKQPWLDGQNGFQVACGVNLR